MNMKQNTVYMLIGSLFTLAGYFLATLANNQPPNAHAQDNTTKIFDKIVCKELEVVDKIGKPIARIREDSKGMQRGLLIYNIEGERFAELDAELRGLILYNVGGKLPAMALSGLFGGSMWLYNKDNNKVASISSIDGKGRMELYNKDEKILVGIGSIKDRPNDGLINIYDYKGNHRSYTAD